MVDGFISIQIKYLPPRGEIDTWYLVVSLRYENKLFGSCFPKYGNFINKGKKDLPSERWLAHEEFGRSEAQGGD